MMIVLQLVLYCLLFFLLMLKSDELEDFLNRLRKQIQLFEQKEVA